MNRMSVLEGSYMYAVLYNGTKYTNKMHVRLSALKFKPAPNLTLATLDSDGRETYAALVKANHSGDVGYVSCACRDCFETAIGVAGVDMCTECDEAGCEHNSECNVERDDSDDTQF